MGRSVIAVRGALILFALLILTSGAALAQNKFRPKGTAEENACKGDSHRYCQEVFPPEKEAEPDQFKMLSCLQAHRAKLSKSCTDMLQNHGV